MIAAVIALGAVAVLSVSVLANPKIFAWMHPGDVEEVAEMKRQAEKVTR